MEEKSYIRKIGVMETVLRDAHQSLLATRMTTPDILGVAHILDNIGFWSLEVWGGATFDSCLRFLKEDPWERLKKIRKAYKNSRLQMLLRGQNLVGYRHYADDVVEKFVSLSADNGIDVFRIFDSLNDFRNIKKAVEIAKKKKKTVEATICYTTSPVHTNELFTEMALELEEMGTDTICIKDMAGLLSPTNAYNLVSMIRKKVSLPIHVHSHSTSGFASMSLLKAIEAGADIIDTAISSMSCGTSHPPTESMVFTLSEMGYDIDLDLEKLKEVADYFRNVRKKYGSFESEYTNINADIIVTQVPGGMMSNLASQLKEQNALDKMEEVLYEVPQVREDFGFPPLVTPTSQIVGTQAALNVITGEKYKVVTSETKNYLKGYYGKPPAPINEEVQKGVLGGEEIITVRPADLIEPELSKDYEEIKEYGLSPEDLLTYVLFPKIAVEFFKDRKEGKLPDYSKTLDESLMLNPEQRAKVSGETLLQGFERDGGLAPSEFNVTVHGESYKIKIAGVGHKSDQKRPFFLNVDGVLEEVVIESLTEIVPSAGGEIVGESIARSKRPSPKREGDVYAPMPGRITKVMVKEGIAVKAGDTVLIVEAMKMENEIHTPIDGIVKEIYVKEGDNANPDETLIYVEACNTCNT
ncbi:MAG: sodium-extruding oxaloacetate decarboxylase subunit alpha [Deltaproteobacteria bacterium]|jgi:pyruvate carboxylase subunit B|nr:sodium-extruding oxaloacetate decarboxylase subunit alpha [Deltaproteobacteria bacterium]MCL5880505.1 sodium-extruding oxaloacetate decarboxylase subunit alpha [Deltaproteobacteria bacterium]MDA8304686.1 sodium-extruding oxaloacetate decarboxylase subunit alpha [Deltaproteobacteria bacterium]